MVQCNIETHSVRCIFPAKVSEEASFESRQIIRLLNGRRSTGELTTICQEAADYLHTQDIPHSVPILWDPLFWQPVVCRTLAPGIHVSMSAISLPTSSKHASVIRNTSILTNSREKLNSLLRYISSLIFLRQCFFHLCSHEQCFGMRGEIWSLLHRELAEPMSLGSQLSDFWLLSDSFLGQ